MEAIILILSIIVAGLSLKDAHFTHKFPFIKNVKKREYLITGFAVAILILSYIKSRNDDQEKKRKEDDNRKEAAKHDSIGRNREDSIAEMYNRKLDSNYQKSLHTYTTTLAKFGLHYDSSQNTVRKMITDSSQRETVGVIFCNPTSDGFAPLSTQYLGDTAIVNVKICYIGFPRNVSGKVYCFFSSPFDKLTLLGAETLYNDPLKLDGAFTTIKFKLLKSYILAVDTTHFYFDLRYEDSRGRAYKYQKALKCQAVTNDNLLIQQEGRYQALIKKNKK